MVLKICHLKGLTDQFKKALKDCLFNYYIKEWHLHLKSTSDKKKCCSKISTFQQNFGFGNYLRSIKNFEHWRSLTHFRVYQPID
jgi:hypothetical protein